ncbi:MAG: nuclear transport factor 2 family protein [Casimicrobium sp.]
MGDALIRIVTFYETLTEQTLPQLRELYAANAYFKDPFNEVNNIAAVEKIFVHMFVSLHEPRFVVTTKIAQGSEAFLIWDFKFRIKKYKPNETQTIRGASHLRFDEAGSVVFHRDYWDAAEELYEKLPLIGTVIRFAKRRVG